MERGSLLVINRLRLGLPETSEHWLLQVLDVDDISRGLVVTTGRCIFDLIRLIIKQQMGHGIVNKPALMGIGSTLVGGAGDDLHRGLIGNIVNSERILVVSKADLVALVLFARALVDNALGIMNVAIIIDAALVDRLSRVGDVDHVEASLTRPSASSTDSVDHLGLFMGDNVVGRAEAGEMGGLIGGSEVLGLLDLEEL